MRTSRATVVVFGTSAAVLVLEIIADRLMAPYVGISLETFTGTSTSTDCATRTSI